jgi:hypothetical protein
LSAALARALAELAGLPLGAGRDEVVAALLAEWMPTANELSRKMSAIEHMALQPATIFTHAPTEDAI